MGNWALGMPPDSPRYMLVLRRAHFVVCVGRTNADQADQLRAMPRGSWR